MSEQINKQRLRSVRDALNRIPAIEALSTEAREAFVEIYNQMIEANPMMSMAAIIPLSINAARRRVNRSADNTVDISDSEFIDKNTLRDRIERLGEAVERQINGPVVYIDSDDFYVYVRDWQEERTYRYAYVMMGNQFFIDVTERQSVVRETIYMAEDMQPDETDEPITRSTLASTLKSILSNFGGSKREQGYVDGNVPVIKQFNDEQMIAIEPLYVSESVADAHSEGFELREDLEYMVKSFNDNITKIKGNIGHLQNTPKVEPVKAWINECECIIGDTPIPEGQPIVKVQFHDETLWKARKENKLCGVSIGAQGKRVLNPDYRGDDA